MSAYDIESLTDDVKTIVQNNLNTKIAAINTEKGDSVSLSTVDSNAYCFQSLNGANINYDPFIYYYVRDVKSEGYEGYTSKKVELIVTLLKEDQGMDQDIGKRMLRYLRALEEVIQENFDQTQNGIKLRVQSLVPIEVTLMDSSHSHRAVGVLIDADLG